MNYSALATTVTNLIASFGQTVTLRNFTVGAYSNGEATITPSDQTGSGVLLQYKDKEIDGTVIRYGDRKLFLSVDGITAPTLDSRVIINSEVWLIVSPAEQINPAGTPLVYILHLRK